MTENVGQAEVQVEGAPMWTALAMQEPPLSRLFRSLEQGYTDGETRHVTVNSLDGSTVKGLVTEVNDEGTTVTLTNGGDDFVFDIAAVCMVKLERQQVRP